MNYAPIDFNYSFKKNQKFIYADPLNARFYSKFDRNLLGAEVFFLWAFSYFEAIGDKSYEIHISKKK